MVVEEVWMFARVHGFDVIVDERLPSWSWRRTIKIDGFPTSQGVGRAGGDPSNVIRLGKRGAVKI